MEKISREDIRAALRRVDESEMPPAIPLTEWLDRAQAKLDAADERKQAEIRNINAYFDSQAKLVWSPWAVTISVIALVAVTVEIGWQMHLAGWSAKAWALGGSFWLIVVLGLIAIAAPKRPSPEPFRPGVKGVE